MITRKVKLNHQQQSEPVIDVQQKEKIVEKKKEEKIEEPKVLKESVEQTQKVNSFFRKHKQIKKEEHIDINSINNVQLFDFDQYFPFTQEIPLPVFIYSCLRFEVMMCSLSKTVKSKFPFFNFRVYYTDSYKQIATLILKKLNLTIFNLHDSQYFPVGVDNNNTVYFCEFEQDNTYIEYIIKLYLDGYYYDRGINKIVQEDISLHINRYRKITLNNYLVNTVSEPVNYDEKIYSFILNTLMSNSNKLKTSQYLDDIEMCNNCYFKTDCIRNPKSLPLHFY